MAQLLVRNLPPEVKARLQRRAKHNKRSLEAEVREILAQVPEPRREVPAEGMGTALARQFSAKPLPQEVWDEFDRNMAELRANWKVRDADLGK